MGPAHAPLHLAVAQQRVIRQVPSAARVLKRLAVAFARKVDPLRVAELVADEVEVGFPAEGEREQPRELVATTQRYKGKH